MASIMMYGAEIWGWEEWGEIERLQEKYGRWTLGVKRETPEYAVRDELDMDKLRVRAGKRAISFEKKARTRNRILLKMCIEERIRREGKERKG